MSVMMPCIIATGIISLPEYRMIDGNIMSIELTPAADIGASLPKYLLISPLPNSATISLTMLASRAIVPSSVASCMPTEGSFNCVMSTDVRE